MRSTGIVPVSIYPGAIWRRVVSLTLRPFYPANNHRTLRIGGSVDPRAGLDSLGEEKQSLALAEIEEQRGYCANIFYNFRFYGNKQ